jgi:hypothetical protein
LKFTTDKSDIGNSLFKEAEVTVILDEIVLKAWAKGGYKSSGIKVNGNRLVITDNNAEIKDLEFESKEIGTVDVKFHFLTKEITAKEKFLMNVTQKISESGKTFGGESYEIRKYPREVFYANAGNSILTDKNEPVLLSATNIGEPAIYNWYDSEGNLLSQGIDFNTSVTLATKYKLEVISLEDGYKDYDEIEIKLKPNNISNIFPNPAVNQLTVEYKINKANSAYISVVGTYGSNTSNNYILNVEQDSIQIDLSTYPSGVYSIVLISDGEVTDSKTLIKE